MAARLLKYSKPTSDARVPNFMNRKNRKLKRQLLRKQGIDPPKSSRDGVHDSRASCNGFVEASAFVHGSKRFIDSRRPVENSRRTRRQPAARKSVNRNDSTTKNAGVVPNSRRTFRSSSKPRSHRGSRNHASQTSDIKKQEVDESKKFSHELHPSISEYPNLGRLTVCLEDCLKSSNETAAFKFLCSDCQNPPHSRVPDFPALKQGSLRNPGEIEPTACTHPNVKQPRIILTDCVKTPERIHGKEMSSPVKRESVLHKSLSQCKGLGMSECVNNPSRKRSLELKSTFFIPTWRQLTIKQSGSTDNSEMTRRASYESSTSSSSSSPSIAKQNIPQSSDDLNFTTPTKPQQRFTTSLKIKTDSRGKMSISVEKSADKKKGQCPEGMIADRKETILHPDSNPTPKTPNLHKQILSDEKLPSSRLRPENKNSDVLSKPTRRRLSLRQLRIVSYQEKALDEESSGELQTNNENSGDKKKIKFTKGIPIQKLALPHPDPTSLSDCAPSIDRQSLRKRSSTSRATSGIHKPEKITMPKQGRLPVPPSGTSSPPEIRREEGSTGRKSDVKKKIRNSKENTVQKMAKLRSDLDQLTKSPKKVCQTLSTPGKFRAMGSRALPRFRNNQKSDGISLPTWRQLSIVQNGTSSSHHVLEKHSLAKMSTINKTSPVKIRWQHLKRTSADLLPQHVEEMTILQSDIDLHSPSNSVPTKRGRNLRMEENPMPSVSHQLSPGSSQPGDILPPTLSVSQSDPTFSEENSNKSYLKPEALADDPKDSMDSVLLESNPIMLTAHLKLPTFKILLVNYHEMPPKVPSNFRASGSLVLHSSVPVKQEMTSPTPENQKTLPKTEVADALPAIPENKIAVTTPAYHKIKTDAIPAEKEIHPGSRITKSLRALQDLVSDTKMALESQIAALFPVSQELLPATRLASNTSVKGELLPGTQIAPAIPADHPETKVASTFPADHPEIKVAPTFPADHPETKVASTIPADHPEIKVAPTIPADHPETKVTSTIPADHPETMVASTIPADHPEAKIAAIPATQELLPEAKIISAILDSNVVSSANLKESATLTSQTASDSKGSERSGKGSTVIIPADLGAMPHYECGICDFKSKQLGAVWEHALIHDSEMSTHPCNECDYVAQTDQQLRSHKMSHEGERPYPCGLCVRRFFTKTHLRLHQILHHNGSPLSCNKCPFKTADEKRLERHHKAHAQEDENPPNKKARICTHPTSNGRLDKSR